VGEMLACGTECQACPGGGKEVSRCWVLFRFTGELTAGCYGVASLWVVEWDDTGTTHGDRDRFSG